MDRVCLKATYDCVINCINISNEDEMCTNEYFIEIKSGVKEEKMYKLLNQIILIVYL